MTQYFTLSIIISLSVFITACASTAQPKPDGDENPSLRNLDIRLDRYIEQLSSADANQRAWAAYKIGKSAKFAMKAIPALVAILNDNATAVMSRNLGQNFTSATSTTPSDEAVKALAKIGRPAVKPLITSLQSNDKTTQLKAIKALGLIKDNDSIKPLVVFLNHSDRRIRLEAANSLSRFNNPWLAEYFLKGLKSNKPEIQATALYAIGKLKNPATVPALIDLLKKKDSVMRSQLLYIVSQFRDERIVKPLIVESRSGTIKERLEVINVLGNVRDYRVIEHLLHLLKDKNKSIRIAAADALVQISGVELGVSVAKWQRWWDNKLKRSQRK